MSSNDDGGGWTVVTASDKKRVMRKGKRGRKGIVRKQQPPPSLLLNDNHHHSAARTTEPTTLLLYNHDIIKEKEDSKLINIILAAALFQECKTFLLQTDLWKRFLLLTVNNNANATTDWRNVSSSSELVCFGIGNFLSSFTNNSNNKKSRRSRSRSNNNNIVISSSSYSFPASFFQLVFAVCLAEELDIKERVFYDPVSTTNEIIFLQQQLQFHVLTENCKGKYNVTASNKNRTTETTTTTTTTTTIFFMPHCPLLLYENVIWANWGIRSSSSSIVIIGNSFRNLTNVHHHGQHAACPCIHSILPYLDEEEVPLVASSKDCEEAPGNLLGAFNDTYISRYSNVQDWPKRPYDETMTFKDDVELL